MIQNGVNVNMSRLSRKPTLWTLRKVPTRISLIMPRRANQDRHLFASCGHYSITQSPLRRNVSVRISLRELRRLIWSDTLRRGHTIGSSRENDSYVLVQGRETILSRLVKILEGLSRWSEDGLNIRCPEVQTCTFSHERSHL